MTRPVQGYPNELRRKVLDAILAHQNKHELARQFRVSIGFVYRVWARYCETGIKDRLIQSRHGPAGQVNEAMKKRILLMLHKRPEMEIVDVQRFLQARGIRLSRSRVHQILQSVGWSMEKKKALISATSKNSAARKVTYGRRLGN
jgi:transposase